MSIFDCYELCYGPVPPKYSSSERKWLDKCLEIDETLFPKPMEGGEEAPEEEETEEKAPETEEDKAAAKKEEEKAKKEADKKKKDRETLLVTGAMKHFKKCSSSNH